MWIGALVFVMGFTALIIGARLSTIVEDGIRNKVEENVIVTESSAQDGKFMSVVQPFSYFFYDVTNAKEVVLNASVPIVKEIEIKFMRTQQKYDLTVSADTYGYREYTVFTPLNESEYDISLITLNPVFLAAAIGQGASELGFQSGLAPSVFRQNIPLLISPEGFLKEYQLAVVPVYLTSLFAQCLQLPISPFNDSEAGPSACAEQWGVQNQLQDQKRISDVDAAYAKFTGFELSAPILKEVSSLLWNVENNASLTNSVGIQRWGTLGMYAAQAAAGNTSAADLYNASLISLVNNIPQLNASQAQVVVQYLSSQLTSNTTQNEVFYFEVIHTSLVSSGFPVATAAHTWEDLALMQFSQSVLTSSLEEGKHSIFSPALPFEFSAYQLDVQKTSPASCVNLTINETRNFLNYFQQDGSVSHFGAVWQAIVEERAPVTDLDQFSYLGIRVDTVAFIGPYLLNYLPATFILKGKLELGTVQEDGTHPSNTGMFVKRTVREILHGYDDMLLTTLGQNQTWKGFVGPEIHDESEARAWDVLMNRTGKLNEFVRDDVENLDNFRQWQGLSTFELSTDLGKKCPSIAWEAEQEFMNCTVWQNTEKIVGKHHSLQVFPFKENIDVPSLNVFAPDLFRNVWFDYSEDVEVEGIKMRRYRIRTSELKNAADNANNSQAQERSNNYRIAISGFQDLSTAYDMTPIHLGLPRHYSNVEEHNKIHGVTTGDWNDTSNTAALETFLDVEPLTGKVMQGRQRLQVNMRLDTSRFDGLYQSMYTGGGTVMFPIMWAQEGDTISIEDAEEFRSGVYGNRKVAKTWTVVLIVLGMLLMVVGLGLLCKGWRVYRIKDANETMPLRASDKKAFI